MNSTRRVVLVGAGHAHLHTLQHAAGFARRGVELVVIAPVSIGSDAPCLAERLIDRRFLARYQRQPS